MKKTLIFLTAILVGAAAFSCSGNPADSSTSFTAEKLSEAAYKTEKMELPENAGVIYLNLPYNGGNSRFIVGSAEVSPAFWTADGELTEFERVELADFDFGVQYNLAVSGKGEIAEIVIIADYGDLPDPDPSSPDYDEAMYDAAAEYSLRLRRYSIDGKLLSDSAVRDYNRDVDRRTNIGEIAYDGDFVVAEIGGSYDVFSIDGRYLGELSGGEDNSVSEVCCDSSGAMVCAFQSGTDNAEICKVKGSDCSTESIASYELGETIQQMTCGSGDYSLFIRTRSTIYGVNAESGDIEAIFSVNATNLNNNNINSFALDSGGFMCVCTTDYSSWKSKFTRFIPCDPSELENIKPLRVGVPHEFWMDTQTEAFNDSGATFQVERVIYSNETEGAALSQFEEDMLSGNLPDVLVLDDGGTMNNIDVLGKGALIDLMPFMEKDEEYAPENIFPNLLEAITDDGKVYSLPERFYADMGYVCKKKYADDLIHGDWNFDTFMDVLENMPEGMGVTHWDFFGAQWERLGIADTTWWIDAEKATCNFDSDSFIRFMRYCAAGCSDEERDELFKEIYADPMNPTPAEEKMASINQQMQYRNDKTLFMELDIANFETYMGSIKGDFDGEELVYLGKPLPDGAHTYVELSMNSFGITKDSTMQDEAWEFIRFILDYDYEGNGWSVMGFPITEKRFFELAERSRFDDKPRYSDMTENGYGWNDGTKTYSVGPLTDEDIDFIYNCLISAEVPKKQLRITNPAYYTIMDEERQALFAGENTPEQCAKYMQNRMSIYLSENYG